MLDSFMRLVEVLMLLSCWESVSSQTVTVPGIVGQDVVLPCSYEGPLEDVNVHWRDGGNNVLDIINGAQHLNNQDQKYKGRVSSFPEECLRGNFSILIKNLQQEDAGIYQCFIPAEDVTRTISLQVSEAPTGPPTESPSPRSPGPPTGPNLLAVWVGVGVVLLLLLLLVLVLLFIRRRSRRSSSI